MSRDPIENADQPQEVDIHGGPDTQLPPAEAAAERIREFVSWFGDGEVLGEQFENENPPLYARDLEAAAKYALGIPGPVKAFINQRSEYVQAALSGPMSNDDADYYRWQGHMEARRQLAESLGYTVPYKVTDRTEKVLPKLDEPE